MKKNISILIFCSILFHIGVVGAEERFSFSESEIVNISHLDFSHDLRSILTDPAELPPTLPTPTPVDPFAFMKDSGGKSGTSLFTGGVSFNYPIKLPQGRKGMTPNVSFQYSSQSNQFNSIVGFGWDISLGSIFRSTTKGIDTLYTENDFTAEINGETIELILIDSENNVYGAKNEGNFIRFVFENNAWVATDKQGTRYTFGLDSSTRQSDPDDTAKIYKWMLEKVEDRNGNFMNFSYVFHQGQVYPNTIKYTGFNEDQGLYELKFILGERPSYTEYKRGFVVTTDKVIDAVEIYSKETGTPELIYEYDLEYEFKNNAIANLTRITQKKGNLELPATQFFYYNGQENESNKKINVLKKVQFPYGGSEEFTYRPSTANKIGNSQANPLPFVVHTVHEIKKKASVNAPEYITEYEYEGGHYYYDNLDAYKKEYAGFHKAIVTDPEGNVSTSYFHQSEFSPDNEASSLRGEFEDNIVKKGRVFREESHDSNGNLQTVVIRKWNQEVLPDEDPEEERSFVFLERETAIDYDGNDSFRAKSNTFQHDDYGNVIQEIDYGEVDISSNDGSFTDIGIDKITSYTDYIANDDMYLHSFPSRKEIRDNESNIIGETKFYYDQLEFGNVHTGNVTATLQKEGDNSFVKTKMEYNEYGLPIVMTNPRGFTTTVSYDLHNLFPLEVQNALGQTTQFEYDYRFGVQSSTIDPNNLKNITEYDDFGRVSQVFVSNPENVNSEILQQEIFYDFSTYPVFVTERKYLEEDVSIDSFTYFDGFARPIQVRTKAEENNVYTVSHTEYDSRGNVKKEYLPLFSEGTSYTEPLNSTPGTTYEYDSQNRQIELTTSLGTTYSQYDNWEIEITDVLENKKNLIYDSRGNLIRVDEYLDDQQYATHYSYNSLNQLEKITDALGNEKHFTYDLLGRKLSEEQLHTPEDMTFGTSEFAYDRSGNLVYKKDAMGNEIKWTYDKLDRLVMEDYTRQNGMEIKYIYDEGINGIGRLTSVNSEGANDIYEYDILGRNTREERRLSGYRGIFETQFSYNLLGLLTSVHFPQQNEFNIKALYEYNNAGQLEEIKYKNMDTEEIDSVVMNLDYGPTGMLIRSDFANGVHTENTFDINEQYRLTDKVTTNQNRNLQSLHYTYDGVGNVTEIVDLSGTNTGKHATYEYDDLYRLTGANIVDTANEQDYTYSYGYDIVGNILNKPGIDRYVYAGNDPQTSSDTIAHPHAVTIAGEIEYMYDANGNLVSDGDKIYSWNYKNQMTHSRDSRIEVDYYYDHKNARVSKIPNGRWGTFYVNKYFDSKSNSPKLYFYAGNLKIATLTLDGLIYHHEDHLTGSNIDTNEEGNINQVLDYYPYGDIRLDDQLGDFDNDYKFTGKEKDDETGLYYYGARYYDSNIGRFVGIDPWEGDLTDPQSFNKYSYVTNNPLKYVDPSGESPIKPQLASYKIISRRIKMFEKNNPHLDANQTLSNISKQFKKSWDNASNRRYFYTDKSGWIDSKHFFVSADQTSRTGNLLTKALGLGVEIHQFITKSPSGFSYEDLPSNSAGIDFYNSLQNDLKKGKSVRLSQSFNNYIQNLNPTSPKDAPNYDEISSGDDTDLRSNVNSDKQKSDDDNDEDND